MQSRWTRTSRPDLVRLAATFFAAVGPRLRIPIVWLGLALVAGPAAIGANTDVVVLRNGDHLTGEVEQLERGRLTFKTDDMGTLAIEWDNVRSVAATAMFDLDDLNGKRYLGSLEPGAGPAELRIVSNGGAVNVPLRSIVRIRRLGATFWQRLDGSLDVGASYTSAGELFKLDLAATLRTERPGYEISAGASSSVTSQPGVEDARRGRLSLTYSRRFVNRWVALVKTQVEQNRDLGFDLRGSAAGGGGRYLVQSQRDRLLAGLGLSVNRERPVEGSTTTNVEATAMLTYDRFSYDFPKVDVAVVAAGYASLNDSGRYRVEIEASLKRELVKDFYLSLRGYESYDSRPATEGARRNDYGITFAVGWSF